jgi:hypothetical protein
MDIEREVVMRLNFFFKVCELLVQARSAKTVRTLLWAAAGTAL